MDEIEKLWKLHDTASGRLNAAQRYAERYETDWFDDEYSQNEVELMTYVVSDLEEKIKKRLRSCGYMPFTAFGREFVYKN